MNNLLLTVDEEPVDSSELEDLESNEAEDERPRDPAIDAAIADLLAFFDHSPNELFYSIQIQTALERKYFHWITGKALLELTVSHRIQRIQQVVRGNAVNFYAHIRHRYLRRQLADKVGILDRVFDPAFAHAVGLHGELMFDAALGRYGFRAEGRSTNSWNGKHWDKTNHNLDRIITRDGLLYGVEIKNTQGYISREELEIKLDICDYLDLIPLFIVRFAPKSYIYKTHQRGGFSLLFEDQMYPFGQSELVQSVKQALGLKVHSPRDVKDGDVQRFLRWHDRRRAR